MKSFRRLAITLIYSLFGAGLIFGFQNCSSAKFDGAGTESKLSSNLPMNFKIDAPRVIPVGTLVRFRIDADEALDSVTWTHPERGMLRVNSADGAADVRFDQVGEADMWVELNRGEWNSGRVGFRVSVVANPGDVCAPLNAATAPVSIIGSQQLYTINATAVAQSIYSIEGRMLPSLSNPSIICHQLQSVVWTIDNNTTPVASGTPVAINIGTAQTNPYNLKAALTYRSAQANGSPSNTTVVVHRSMPVRVSTSTTPISCTPEEMNLRLSGPSMVAVGQPAAFTLDLNCLPKNVHSVNGVEFQLNSGNFAGQNTFMYSQTFQSAALNQVLSARIKYADNSYSPTVTKTFNVVGDLNNCSTGPLFALEGPTTVNFYDNGTEAPATYTINNLKPGCVSLNLTPPKVITWTSNNTSSTSSIASQLIVLGLAGDLASAPDLIRASFEDNLGRPYNLELPITLDRVFSPPPNCQLTLTSNPGTGVVTQNVSFTASLTPACASGGYQEILFEIKNSANTLINTNKIALSNLSASHQFVFETAGNYVVKATAGFVRGRGGFQTSNLIAEINPFVVRAAQPICPTVEKDLVINPMVTGQNFVANSRIEFTATLTPDVIQTCHSGLIHTEWLMDGKFVYLRDLTDGLTKTIQIPSTPGEHTLTLRVFTRRDDCLNFGNKAPDGTANGIDYAVGCRVADVSNLVIERDFKFNTIAIGDNCTAQITGPTHLSKGESGTFNYSYSGTGCPSFNRVNVTVSKDGATGETQQMNLPELPYSYIHSFDVEGTYEVSVQLVNDLCGPLPEAKEPVKGADATLSASIPVCLAAQILGPIATHRLTVGLQGYWEGVCVRTCNPILSPKVNGWTCVSNSPTPPTSTDPLVVCGEAPKDPPPDNVHCLDVMPNCEADK